MIPRSFLVAFVLLMPMSHASGELVALYIAPGGASATVDGVRIHPPSIEWEWGEERSIGGAEFPASGTPLSIRAEDDGALPVSLYVCQDADLDNLCGGFGEPYAYGCGTAALPGTFVSDRDVLVYVLADATCGGVPTTGALYYAYG